MSTLCGHVGSSPLVVGPAAVLVCLLVVSTPHLAEAMRVIGWSVWQAWAFAIALDCCIVCCEALQVLSDAELGWLPTIGIGVSVTFSAVMNSYVNLRHAKIVQ